MNPRANHLAKMANQIGAFFSAQSEEELAQSAKAVAAHLKLYWAPSMREQLVAEFERGEADEVSPVVALALRTHRASLMHTNAHTAEEDQEVFPQGGGDAG